MARSPLPILLLLPLLGACHSEDYVRLYATDDKAPSLSWEEIGALEHMGPTLVDEGVNFAVYSKNATRVDLLLFEDPESSRPTRELQMTRYGDVWNLYVEGVGEGQHYGYVAWGPNWEEHEEWYPGSMKGFRADVDEAGNRMNPNKLLTDPYGKALHRDHDWGGGYPASGPYADDSTYAASAKSVVVVSDYEWSEHEDAWRAARQSADHEGHDWNELVIYEVHVKGFSENAGSTALGVEHFGTYRGLGEGAAYFADLGVNAVELLPVHEKPSDGGYWGYNNISYFAPEITYSAAWQQTGEVDEVIDEFKEMVDRLHQQGVEVIVDVVYNHTGEGGLWRTKLFFDDNDSDGLCDPADAVDLDSLEVASLYNLRGLDNQSYYVLTEDGQFYWEHTGVGNQTRANHEPMRRMIIDSLRYYVEELHVDGFRFDLAGVLGEDDLGYENGWSDVARTVLQDIADDPVLQQYNTRIIAEPWTTAYDPSTGFPVAENSELPYGWAEWNANFRDWWRSFVNQGYTLGDYQGAISGGGAMTGSYDRYAWNGRQPWHSVNFVTIHDGFTMFDLVSYEEKQNGCGPLNPICCYDACSAWCDPTSGESNNHSANWSDEPEKRQMIRNLFVGLLISHGTPTLLGGDEWLRTQYGNNNAYSTWADNEWNWFRWGEWTSENTNNLFRLRMHDFVRDLVAFRRAHTYALSPKTWDGGMPYAWKNAENEESGAIWDGRHLMLHYYDPDGSWEEPELAILINLEDEDVAFELPSGRSWGRVVDTQSYYDLPGNMDESERDGYFNDEPDADPTASANIWLDEPLVVSGSYTVAAGSIVILEEQD